MRLLRVLLVTLVLLVVAFHARRFVLAAYSEYRSFHPVRHSAERPADADPFRLEEVSFEDESGRVIRGWFVSGTSGSAIVALHGGGANRGQMLPAARLLAQGGHAVLLFDWPGHGTSDGEVEYGASERAALEGALSYLQRRPGVDPARVGVYGFSLGAYIALQVAADDERIAALAVAAAASDILEQVTYEYRSGGLSAQWGARLGMRLGGFDATRLPPRDVVGRIAPRPLLIVNGEEDGAVAASMARELHARAGDPKELLLIRELGHAEPVGSSPGVGAPLRAFFDRTLAPPAADRGGGHRPD